MTDQTAQQALYANPRLVAQMERTVAQPETRVRRGRPAPRIDEQFLTVDEVAKAARVSKMTIYRLVRSGELAAVRVGKSFRIPLSAANQYLGLVAETMAQVDAFLNDPSTGATGLTRPKREQ